MTMDARIARGRTARLRVAAIAVAAFQVAAVAASAEPPCVPGSIGPSGCDSIRPEDERTERLGVEPAPDLESGVEQRSERLVEFHGVSPAGSVEVLRLDRTVPRDPAMGRDPRAVQSFQTPYIFE